MTSWFMKHFTWRYVGVSTGMSNVTDDSGKTVAQYVGYFILEETGSGRRQYKLIGDPGRSRHAIKAKAFVEAWIRGGPLPVLDPEFSSEPPLRKSATVLTLVKGTDNE